jgi:hypothetical protein
MNVLPATAADAEFWAGQNPVVFACFVEMPDAYKWHSGVISDAELWARAQDPVEAQFCALFVRRNRHKSSWKTIWNVIQASHCSGVVFRAAHPVIERRAVQWGAIPGFSDGPGLCRYLGTGSAWKAYRGRFPSFASSRAS